jgi:predicted DNA-binding ribbon-helix-helix protein
MKSAVIKRSVFLGRKTSISLEEEFWRALQEIADKRGQTVSQLVTTINADRKFANLSSTLRLLVLDFYKDQLRRIDERDLAHASNSPYQLR